MRRELIRHVARLAALDPDPEAEAALARDLGAVVEWFDALADEPEAESSSGLREPWRSGSRQTVAEPPDRSSGKLVEQAPEVREGWIVVPAVRPRP